LAKIKRENILLAAALTLLVAIVITISSYDGFSATSEKPKIGLIITGAKNDDGWNGRHYQALKSVCERFGLTLLVKENIAENVGDCPQAVKELVGEGAGMIILSSFAYPMEVADIVQDYPRTKFVGISAEHTAKNMTAYFARLYQARYLSGIIAGKRTKSNVLGYVAAMPNAEVNRGINAFALGAQSVNPQVKVVVVWTNSWQDDYQETVGAHRLIKEAGADVLTYHQNKKSVANVAESMGVDFIAYHETLSGYSPHYLTSVLCHWEIYYTEIVENFLKGSLNAEKINWLGIERNAVYLGSFSDRVTEDMRLKVEQTRQNMLDGFLIFSGEIYDNEGNLRSAADEALSDDILLTQVDWLVKGVEVLD